MSPSSAVAAQSPGVSAPAGGSKPARGDTTRWDPVTGWPGDLADDAPTPASWDVPTGEELWQLLPSPPDDAAAWLADPPAEPSTDPLDAAEPANGLPAWLDGFAGGGVLDTMVPGLTLAGFTSDASERRLSFPMTNLLA